jgi:hypothetical protein
LALACSSRGSSSLTMLGDMWSASRMSSMSWAMPWPSGMRSVMSTTSPSLSSLEFGLRVPSAMFWLALVSLGAVSSHHSMMWSHRGIEHGCRNIYFSFSQQQTTVSMQRSFSRHCTCKGDFAGTTISCLLGKQLQKVQKHVNELIYLCSHKGRLNLTSI